ncbi:MAG: bifunctional alpha,alpha-trehalose-phosphate synthase (UDP-forming)/trehalose-phosphatase [Candidatus Sericytochromatia bacterium]
MRWLIISNRLPIRVGSDGKISRSSGGLVSALAGVHSEAEQLWVGIAPDGVTPSDWEALPATERAGYHPIFVDPARYDAYYNGIANDVFWPLFHYEGALVHFSPEDWEDYQAVNAQMAEEIAALCQPGDVVWVHDFHLMLLPQMLRERQLPCPIGFFLHIPFPSSELFRQLPVRREILTGLLGADLIGFHDSAYLRHFCNSLLQLFDVNSNLLSVGWQGREVRLGVYPVSIDAAGLREAAAAPVTQEFMRHYESARAYRYLILGVDRLDYSKGLLLKLKIIYELLSRHPELRGQVSLLQLAIPTRQDVSVYRQLKGQFERLVGEVNGAFSQPNYTPVQYMYKSVSLPELLALYRLADVMLVTSRRDGMNLVAMEYVMAQPDARPGVLALSEFAGAASMLSEALLLNPWDTAESAERVAEALRMPDYERRQRTHTMQRFLLGYTASDWAAGFMADLDHLPDANTARQWRLKPAETLAPLHLPPAAERPLLLFLDYDGTLVPLEDQPEMAVLDGERYALLEALCRDTENLQVMIVSGRDAGFLERQFAGLPLGLVAEHGALFRPPGQTDWRQLSWSDVQTWYKSAEVTMNAYARRVPNSRVEHKAVAIAWHYRNAPAEFGEYQARKLKEDLEIGLSHLPVAVLSGKKVIEARAMEANKGYFVRNYLNSLPHDHTPPVVMAMGDDTTDEEMMLALNEALPSEALTIKVGTEPSAARFRLRHQEEVLPLLQALLAHYRKASPEQPR